MRAPESQNEPQVYFTVGHNSGSLQEEEDPPIETRKTQNFAFSQFGSVNSTESNLDQIQRKTITQTFKRVFKEFENEDINPTNFPTTDTRLKSIKVPIPLAKSVKSHRFQVKNSVSFVPAVCLERRKAGIDLSSPVTNIKNIRAVAPQNGVKVKRLLRNSMDKAIVGIRCFENELGAFKQTLAERKRFELCETWRKFEHLERKIDKEDIVTATLKRNQLVKSD